MNDGIFTVCDVSNFRFSHLVSFVENEEEILIATDTFTCRLCQCH